MCCLPRIPRTGPRSWRLPAAASSGDAGAARGARRRRPAGGRWDPHPLFYPPKDTAVVNRRVPGFLLPALGFATMLAGGVDFVFGLDVGHPEMIYPEARVILPDAGGVGGQDGKQLVAHVDLDCEELSGIHAPQVYQLHGVRPLRHYTWKLNGNV